MSTRRTPRTESDQETASHPVGADVTLLAIGQAPQETREPFPLTVDRLLARDLIAQGLWGAIGSARDEATTPWTCTCPTAQDPEAWCEHQVADRILDEATIGAPALQAMDWDALVLSVKALRREVVNGQSTAETVTLVADLVERLAGGR